MLGSISTVSGVYSEIRLQKEQRLRRLSAAQQQEDSFMEGLSKLRRERKLSVILMKMQAGKKLSPGEMQYLRENAGGTYEKAAKTARQREGYKQALKSCRSKEEVRRFLSSRLLVMGGAPKAGEAPPSAEGGAVGQGAAAPGQGLPGKGMPGCRQAAALAQPPSRAAGGSEGAAAGAGEAAPGLSRGRRQARPAPGQDDGRQGLHTRA